MTALDQIMLAIKAEHEAAPERFDIPAWLDHSSFLAGLAVAGLAGRCRRCIRATNFGPAESRANIATARIFRHHLDAGAANPISACPLPGRMSGRWTFQ